MEPIVITCRFCDTEATLEPDEAQFRALVRAQGTRVAINRIARVLGWQMSDKDRPAKRTCPKCVTLRLNSVRKVPVAGDELTIRLLLGEAWRAGETGYQSFNRRYFERGTGKLRHPLKIFGYPQMAPICARLAAAGFVTVAERATGYGYITVMPPG